MRVVFQPVVVRHVGLVVLAVEPFARAFLCVVSALSVFLGPVFVRSLGRGRRGMEIGFVGRTGNARCSAVRDRRPACRESRIRRPKGARSGPAAPSLRGRCGG